MADLLDVEYAFDGADSLRRGHVQRLIKRNPAMHIGAALGTKLLFLFAWLSWLIVGPALRDGVLLFSHSAP